MSYQDIVDRLLDSAQISRVTYVDVRVVEDKIEGLTVKNGILRQVKQYQSLGVGVRVLKDGGWGFAGTADLSLESLDNVLKRALEIAKASAITLNTQFTWDAYPAIVDSYHTPYEIDPFTISLDDKIAKLMSWDKLMKSVNGISLTEGYLEFRKRNQWFGNSEGSRIDQHRIETGVGIAALAVGKDEVQVRSYPNSFRGQHSARGYELISQYDLEKKAPEIAEEAVKLLSAKQCPVKETTVVLGSSQLGLQIHESCGHPTELDRIMGLEANFAGESFMRIEDLNKLAYGSPIVNIYADATIPGALGSFGYDDEGVKAQRFDIVKNGILTNYLTSRDMAPLVKQTSNGAMRADGWSAPPLIRMTNISLAPGDKTFEELIGEVDDGIFMDWNKTWSIDHYRINFQFGCEVGYEIKNGKLGEMVKNPQYTSMTVPFWNSCDGLGNKSTWEIWGIPNCGKGQPIQTARVAHGAPVARFRNVKVGVGYEK